MLWLIILLHFTCQTENGKEVMKWIYTLNVLTAKNCLDSVRGNSAFIEARVLIILKGVKNAEREDALTDVM